MADPRSPKSPRKGKVVSLRVSFLNDTVHAFQIPVKAVGLVLWDAVVSHLQLVESDYFGLEYTNHSGDECWLDNSKQILKQLPSPDSPLRFGVKFYTPDPGLLEDELTRYCFALQVRRDLYSGELHCSENTAALLASYIVQGEIGDFLVDEYVDISYLSTFDFVPKSQQTAEMLHKVMDYHRQHVGESPSEADSNLLDTARKVEMYGIKFHPAKDHEGVALNLAVAHLGVLVFQGMTKINTFSWAKVRKLSFKRKKFLIKLHPESYGYYKDTVEFFFDSRDRCKYFWKKCIEHHTFFRCQTVKKPPRNKSRVVSRGSSFRYSGRTQKELQEYVRDSVVKRPQVERSTSGRISSRSTSVTPKFSAKPSMHNSSDLHNSTASSGSHILETSTALPPLPPTRLETAEVHSDSSMSGSRSLGSPRLEHGLSADSEGGDFINQPVDVAAVDARLPHSDSPGADSDSDKFDDIPLSVSDHLILQPDVPYSNLIQSRLHPDDENVTDADVDDEFDNDDKAPANHVLSANQNAKDLGGKETGEKPPTPSVVENNVVEYVNSQSLAADHVTKATDSTSAAAARDVGDTQAGGQSSSTASHQRDKSEADRGKIDSSDSVPKTAPKPDSSSMEEDASAGATSPTLTTTAATATTTSATAMQDHPPSTTTTPSQPMSMTQAEVHSPRVEESPGRGTRGDAGTVTSTSSISASSVSSASALIVDADLNEDIPYVLHRRQYKEGEETPGTPTTTARKSAETPSPQATLLRQSRSKSPRGRLLHEGSLSPDSMGRKLRADRSPSAGRRIELVHYNKLPARDSFSSVDDTTSPTFEKDFLKPGSVDSPQGEPRPLEAAETKPAAKVSQTETRPVETVSQVETEPAEHVSAQPETKQVDSVSRVEAKPADSVGDTQKQGLDKAQVYPVPAAVLESKEIEIPAIDWLDSKPETAPAEPEDVAKEQEKSSQKEGGKPEESVLSRAAKADRPKSVLSEAEGEKLVPDTRQKVLPEVLQRDAKIPQSVSAMKKEALSPPSPPLPPPPSSPPLPSPPPPIAPLNHTSEKELNQKPLPPAPPTKPQVAAKPKPPPVMPKSAALAKKPPVAPKTKIVPTKPPRESPPHAHSVSSHPTGTTQPSSSPSMKMPPSPPVARTTAAPSPSEESEFPPPPSEMTSSMNSISGDLDLESLPPPPSELLMDLSSQSSGTSPESPASLPPLPPELSMSQVSTPNGQKPGTKEKQPDSEKVPNGARKAVNGDDKGTGQQRAPQASDPNSSEAQRIMDLPSPAAALIFSDSPPSQSEAAIPALTFTTFRPDSSEADSIVTVTATSTMTSVPSVSVSDLGSSGDSGESVVSSVTSGLATSPRDPRKRWSLERVEEEPSGEGEEEGDKRKPEPKRVSWHEEPEAARSYHSDVSLAVMPSPVDDVNSSLGGSPHRDDMDSRDILETLESLRRQGSESDLTYSGTGSSASEEEDGSTAKEVYLQYAASRCLAESSKDTTIDSGMGEMSSEGTMTTTASQHRESSPLDMLEHLGSLEGSFVSDTRKPSLDDFPPPPPFLRSGGSSSSSSLEMATPSAMSARFAEKRASVDPLLNLEGRDLVDVAYTTSESESDFDEEAETNKMKKLSPECEGAVGGVEVMKEEGGMDGGGSLHVVSGSAQPYTEQKPSSSSSTSHPRS